MAKKKTEDVEQPAKAPEPPILSINSLEMNSQNEHFLTCAFRRIREIVLDGQKRRGDGRIVLEMYMTAGALNGTLGVGPKWLERLGR